MSNLSCCNELCLGSNMDMMTDLMVETGATAYSNLKNFMDPNTLLSPMAPPLILSVMLAVVPMNMKIK